MAKLNLKKIKVDEKPNDITVHSDASDNALGVVLSTGERCHRNLSEEERITSSTYRELSAVLYGLEVFHAHFKGL